MKGRLPGEGERGSGAERRRSRRGRPRRCRSMPNLRPAVAAGRMGFGGGGGGAGGSIASLVTRRKPPPARDRALALRLEAARDRALALRLEAAPLSPRLVRGPCGALRARSRSAPQARACKQVADLRGCCRGRGRRLCGACMEGR